MAAPLLLNHSNRGFRLPTALPNQEEGEPYPHFNRAKSDSKNGLGQGGVERLAHQATATGRTPQNATAVAGLARFFPESTPVRIPVQLARTLQPGEASLAAHFTESIVIEFGTPREVLFACNTPLEFADVLRLR